MPELRYKQDCMPKSIVWGLFNIKYEREREKKEEEKDRKEVGGQKE